jgi:TetR/AcrR family transcriptional regulator, regulator of autoinduction and epiphytic fitness
MDAVAREAPVSKRTLYNHFPSKEALFAAVVTDAYAPFTAPHEACAQACDPRAALRAYVDRMRGHWGHPDVMPLLKLIVAEGATAPGLMDSYLAAGKGPAITELTRIFDFVEDPLGMPAEIRALQFLGMIKEGLFWPGVLGIPAGREPETIIEQAISRILGARG